MRYTKYSQWTGLSWDELSLEELMDALSEYLLRSGFEEQLQRGSRRRSRSWDDEFEPPDPQDTLDALRQAIREALRNSGILD